MAEGSSVGVFIVREDHEAPAAGIDAAGLGVRRGVLVEPFIPGKELTCAVMGDKALGVIEIVPTTRVLRLRGQIRARRLEASAAGADRARGLRGMPAPVARRASRARLPRRHPRRFPLRRQLAGTKGLFCLEVNTQPGMTETSLVPELAAHAGIGFDELVRWMIEDASLDR